MISAPGSTHSPLSSSISAAPGSTQSSSTSAPTSTSPGASITSEPVSVSSTESASIIGPAVGGAVGGVAVLLLVGVAVVLYLRRQRAKADSGHQVVTGGVLVPVDSYYGYYAKATLYVRFRTLQSP